MSFPNKVDGFGTRYIGSDRIVNNDNREKFVRLYPTEAIAKGDVVCIAWATSTNGVGSHVAKAATGTPATQQAMGICAEAASEASTLKPILIQVQGLCDFAKVDISDSVPGDILASGSSTLAAISGTAGELPFAINVQEDLDSDSGDDADSRIYLLNPLNY